MCGRAFVWKMIEAITVVDYRDKCLRGSLTRGPRCKWYETGHEYASLILNTESRLLESPCGHMVAD